MTHETPSEQSWKSVATPFAVDLFAVAQSAEGPVAAGGSGTVVAERTDGWETVLEDGPGAKNRTLRSADVTDDGTRVWFAGASGAIGMYDLDRQRTYDYSYSKDISASWSAVDVSGPAGEESVLVANGSGTILPFDVDGLSPRYGGPVTPGSGAEITALAHAADGVGYAVDTTGTVYEAGAGGWEAVGIEQAASTLRDVTVGPDGRLYVASADGVLYRRDGATWTAVEVPASGLRAVDVHDGHVAVLAVGNVVYRRPLDGRDRWRKESTPTGNDLLSLALDGPDVAVGKSGTVVERPAASPPPEESPAPTEPSESRIDVCELLVSELVGRLEREELTALLRRREACDGSVVEQLNAASETESGPTELLAGADGSNLLVLPVAGADALSVVAARGGDACACECDRSERPCAALERLLDGC
ncbi:WD40/YVTN/BNR-like repeat-containing protein [Halosimplex aquaticum]|uniref:WD40/YVTN/BNR-like repeat-containing protein n=1 Tax=Halosimplex aquaticum TaxID=3026162 RepID=A0ABD5XYP5_9EURY|nr:hypothetical protein [Halosimplex aquaticum]